MICPSLLYSPKVFRVYLTSNSLNLYCYESWMGPCVCLRVPEVVVFVSELLHCIFILSFQVQKAQGVVKSYVVTWKLPIIFFQHGTLSSLVG